jgi:hypothetical protein
MAEPTARIMARELGQNDAWVAAQLAAFRALAETYMVH